MLGGVQGNLKTSENECGAVPLPAGAAVLALGVNPINESGMRSKKHWLLGKRVEDGVFQTPFSRFQQSCRKTSQEQPFSWLPLAPFIQIRQVFHHMDISPTTSSNSFEFSTVDASPRPCPMTMVDFYFPALLCP